MSSTQQSGSTTDVSRFLEDVISGLSQPQKSIPAKYLYDQRGSELFEQICELPEYYPTRTELQILEDHGADIACRLGRDCRVVEYGSGSSHKASLLLGSLHSPVAYVPVEISPAPLKELAQVLDDRFPALEVHPVHADFTRPFELDEEVPNGERTIAYFPGSTIGNFLPAAAADLLRSMAELCGHDGGLVVGVDMLKDVNIIEPAYNDADGVTAEFNLNLLRRINRELDANFDVDRFRHEGRFNPDHSRIEMHLVSGEDQTVAVDGVEFGFEAGESIHTENSHKYTLERFAALAATAGWTVCDVWTDSQNHFSVQYLEPTPPPSK